MTSDSFYQGKIVIITGGKGGIGKTLVSEYAARGAIVISADMHPSSGKISDLPVYEYRIDIAESTQVKEMFEFITQTFGKPHILINNAALAHFNKDIRQISDEEFTRVIGVNLCGSFYCSRAFVVANQGEEYGRIVNIASTRWNQNEAGWDAYGASKGGLVSLTASLAVSLSDTPVTVNAISPGWIETGDYGKLTLSDHLQHPSGRVGKPEDIARAVLFLTDRKNDFVNGQNLVIDGGMTKRMIYF